MTVNQPTNKYENSSSAGNLTVRVSEPLQERPDRDERFKIDADPEDALRALVRDRD